MSVPEPTEPFVGPRPFERGDQVLFFGRAHEAEKLVSLILSHSAVLLYASSGAGKTSLLQAAAIPLLENEAVQVLGPARVGGESHPEGEREAVKNVFLFNALMSMQPDSSKARELSGQTLADYLAARAYPAPDEDQRSLRLLLFDQFEEIFTSHSDRWSNRGDFFEEIGAALERDTRLRAVFSMREEYIASLDPYVSKLPERLRTRFRLEPLNDDAALEAVKRPVERCHRRFAPGAAEALVENLLHRSVKPPDGMAFAASEFVDALQLQVVCRRLWRALPGDVVEIDQHHIEGDADVDKALEEYYDACITEVVIKHGCSPMTVRTWIEERLITPEKTRGLVRRTMLQTEGLANTIIDELERQHLVHAEVRSGQRWYELIHDRFIAPIGASNRRARHEAHLTDPDVDRLIEIRAFNRANARRVQRKINRPLRTLYRMAELDHSSTDREREEDWTHAELIFALEVLEGQIHLRRLGPSSFVRLERQWLADVKRVKAYLLWEETEGLAERGHPDDYYFTACKHLRAGLLEPGIKASKESFAVVEDYLRVHYLDAGGWLDHGKPEVVALFQNKAYRIYAATQETDRHTNWVHAEEYCRSYYENIIPAVKKQDEKSIRAVLDAFLFSRAPENRFLVINCFEAAIAIYFLPPHVIQEI